MIYAGKQAIKKIVKNNKIIQKVYFGTVIIWEYLLEEFKARVLADGGVYESNTAIVDESIAMSHYLIPKGYKEGKLYAVTPDGGNLDYDYARNSTATRVNKGGVIETVAPNVPRIDYSTGQPKILVEPQRTNLIDYSEDFSNSYWEKGAGVTLTPNDITAPDGTLTATRIQMGGNSRLQSPIFNVFNSHIPSIYVKGIVGDKIGLETRAAVFKQHTLTGEWQRIEANPDTGNIRLEINTYISTARDFYIWGAQFEEGTEATSYIPTNGTTVTRLADQYTNPNYLSELTSRNTRYIETPTEKLLDLNSNGDITESITLLTAEQGLLPQAKIDALEVDRVRYGVNEDIKDELKQAQDLGASLVMLPGKGGAGTLQSIIPADGSGDFMVDRNCEATYVDKDGVIRTAAPNESRFDWSSGEPALLVEPQRTNLVDYSVPTIGVGKWNKYVSGELEAGTAEFIENAEIAPDNTNTAFKTTMSFDPNYTGFRGQIVTKAISVEVGKTYTLSVWLKGVLGGERIRIALMSPSSQGIAGDEIILTSEWKMYMVTIVADAPDRGFQIRDVSGLDQGYFIWGAQLEEGSTATSYIPTDGVVVTRLEDVINNATIPALTTEGVLYAEMIFKNAGNYEAFGISDGSSSNRFVFYKQSDSNSVFGQLRKNDVSITIVDDSVETENERMKIALKFNATEISLFTNGVKRTSEPNTLGEVPALTKLGFNTGTYTSNFFGNNYSFKCYSKSLTDQQLMDLTTL